MKPSNIGAAALALLERIVEDEQQRYDQAYRAANAHNNLDGVGVSFDYAPYPAHPQWLDEAQAIVAKAREAYG